MLSSPNESNDQNASLTGYLSPFVLPSCLLAFLMVVWVLQSLKSIEKKRVYPPGPTPHPIVGHAFQIPSLKSWLYFEHLGKTYGPIVRLSLAGDDIIILNHARDAEELLNRRSHNYSSRKPLIYAGLHQSKNKRLVLLQYGEQLKKQRAAFHHMLQPRVVGSYEHMQERESTKLLFDMISQPTETELNMKRFSASLVFTLAYGKRIGDDDKDLLAVLDIVEGFIQDCYPGSHIVDTFPILDSLPSFLAPWKKTAHEKHEKEMKLYRRLLLDVRDRMDQERDKPPDCFASRLWENNDKTNLDLVSMAYVAGTAFEAGTDTMAGTMMWFIMAMLLYPEALREAQAEVDNLLGHDGKTIPMFKHMDKLPYCVALAKEVFRWMPAAPGGFPHYSDSEDNYKGYYIKAKTMVIPNIWAMQHNEEDFPEPLNFKPERFIHDILATKTSKSALLTEGHFGFGFGRRSCPGKHLAAKTIWIGVTKLLWAFDIAPGLDKTGKIIPVSPDNCTSGITSKPKPFPVLIYPRSKDHERTIRMQWAADE